MTECTLSQGEKIATLKLNMAAEKNNKQNRNKNIVQ